jgi:electron transfer flavoprotein beta subunit
MGADRGILIETGESDIVEPLAVAKLLHAVAKAEQPELIIMGKQAIDDDCNQTGQMLAALAGWPQATFASKVEIEGEVARVTREVDAGLETLEVDLPAVITADLRLNEPRYIKLPDIMKAKKKPLDVMELASLGVDPAPLVKVLRYEPPPQRQKGVMVKDAAELVAALKQKGLLR